MAMEGFKQMADNFNMVLVLPEGLKSSWNAVNCCGESLARNVDDVGFLQQVLEELATDLPFVNADLAYAVGWSNGGYMVTRAAGLFRAVAPIAGHVYGDMSRYINASRPTAFFMHHGAEDDMVRISGCCSDPSKPQCCCGISQVEQVCRSAQQVFMNWAHLNECEDGVQETHIDIERGLVCMTGLGCTVNSTLCIYEDEGHHLPFQYDLIGDFFAKDACEKAGGGEWSHSEQQCICPGKIMGKYCLYNHKLPIGMTELGQEKMSVSHEKKSVHAFIGLTFLVLAFVLIAAALHRVQQWMRYRGFSPVAMTENDNDVDVELSNVLDDEE